MLDLTELWLADTCACGRPLHYTSPQIQAAVQHFVDTLGPTIPIETPDGKWLVPRHYIALHGISAGELPTLAARYGWSKEHA